MSRVRLQTAAVVLAAQASVAMAADVPGAFPPPPPVPVSRVQGWYVRGDVGYGWGRVESAQSEPGYPYPTNNNLGGGFTGGLGVGIKTDWLRTDLTVDAMAPLKYEGTINSPRDTTAKIGAVAVLFNGYLDLGTWYRITPYLGGGVGTAYLHTYDYQSTAAPPFTAGLSQTQWKFAWAAMAGVGYPIAPNLLIDVGYRYLSLGDVHTAQDSSGLMTFKGVAAHEVRAGLRWRFDELPGF